MPNTAYFKSTPGVAKTINLGLGSGILVLSWVTQPTELQKEIVHETWKEYGLFTLSIAGVIFSFISLCIFLLLDRSHSSYFRIIDAVLHFYAAISFLVMGLLVLQSTIGIFLKIGDCCRHYYSEPNATCKLPGPIFDMTKEMAAGTFDLSKFLLPGGDHNNYYDPVKIPDDCSSEISYSPWLCNICINQLIQPMFEWKGAAGAVGILNAIFYGIVGGVGLKLIRETFRTC